jgi:hypothetical protein
MTGFWVPKTLSTAKANAARDFAADVEDREDAHTHAQPGDVVATEHWASSGFPNTDLEHKLKRYGQEKIICIGLPVNTCLEATTRVGMELGSMSLWFVMGPTYAQGCSMLLEVFDIVEGFDAAESCGVSILGDGVGLIEAKDIVGEAA